LQFASRGSVRVSGSVPSNKHRFRGLKPLQVLVRDNNVDQALRVLKKKMQREGIFREMKQRKAYEKPSVRKAREKAEAVRRARKQARKTAIREGLIAAPKPKPRFGAGAPRRPGGSPFAPSAPAVLPPATSA
jgi:small subunit ribosomal protein S21